MAPSLTHEYNAADNPTAAQLSCSASASESTHLPANVPIVTSEEKAALADIQLRKNSRCMKFFSTSGCPYGEQCHFQHFDDKSQGGGQLARTINMASLPTLQGAKKRALMLNLLDPSLHVKSYKTKLCHNYQSATSQGCKYGEHCHFAHSEAELRSKIANICDVANGTSPPSLTSSKLNELNECTKSASPNMNLFLNHCKPIISDSAPMDTLSYSLYYGEESPPGVPLPYCDTNSRVEDSLNPVVVSTRMSIDAGMAGFIIGRAGSNVRQISKLTGSKLSIREAHSQKVRMVHMEGLPHQVDGAQELLKLLVEARKGISSKRSGL